MFGIAIFRRGDNRPAIDKATIDRTERRVNGPKVRVKRPGIVAAIVPAKGRKVSPFYHLPLVPSSIVNNAAALVADGPNGADVPFSESWIATSAIMVDAADLGKYRDGLANVADANSCRNSLRLWITQNLGDVIDPDDLSIVHYHLPE